MATMYKLSDVRSLLETSLGRPVSRQLAYKYACRADFPEPVLSEPIKLWSSDTVWLWLNKLIDGLGLRGKLEASTEDTDTSTAIYRFLRSSGGLRRDTSYWDSGMSGRENRRKWRYLDRKHGGRALDDIATEIAGLWPGSGITDADTLFNWLERG